MKKLKFLSIVVFLLTSFLTTFSQVKIIPSGKTIVGNERTGNDPNNEVTQEFLGLSTDPYRAGGKISIGDYSTSGAGGANVFLAEAWNWDSDQLEVHGKNGIFLTIGGGSSGHGGCIIGAELTSVGDLKVKEIVYSQGFNIWSDIRLKSNVKNLNGSLAAISKLQGLTYDFKPLEEDSILLQLNAMRGKDEKEIKSIENLKKLYEKKKLERVNQIGFSAQEIQKVFPQLVKEDEKGYLSVNYTALVPVLVEGVKEQQAIIEAQRAEIEAMKKDLEKIKKKLGM
jgi:Chaperone of endosialidase